MSDQVINLLYRRPELYEQVYPEPNESTPRFCRAMFERHLGRPPQSILDIGCGTARDLNVLSRQCPDCCGVDLLPEVVRYVQQTRPHLRCTVGDMRDVRLERAYESILCLGSALTYATTDKDVDATLATFAAHAVEGTLLLLELVNAAGWLPGGACRLERQFRVDTPELRADVLVRHEFDRRRQLLVRHRRWIMDAGNVEVDYCRYRLLFPAELRYRLQMHEFTVLDMFDNKDLIDRDLTEPTLYVVAQYGDVRRSGEVI